MINQSIIEGLQAVADKYGREYAIMVERIYRNETRHFQSGNFLKTFSPGMEVGKAKVFPFGWPSLADFWKKNTFYAPSGTFDQEENNSRMMASRGVRTFIKFPTVKAGMMTLAELLRIRNGNAGAWFSHDVTQQQKYADYLKGIVPRFVNNFIVDTKSN